MSRNGSGGWRPWSVIPRVAGGVVSVPVVVGFVALGAVVVVGRSLRGVARETWARLPGLHPKPPPPEARDEPAEPVRGVRRDQGKR